MFCPLHQFEIRYSGILNSLAIKEIVSLFIKFTTRITIENENSFTEKIVLHFDDQYFQIVILWDRIMIRIEVDDYESLLENGSKIEEPFMNIFGKITKLNGFGENINILSNIIFIYPIKNTFEVVANQFSTKHIHADSLALLGMNQEFGIKFTKEEQNLVHYIQLSPYQGLKELRKINIDLKNPELIKQSDCVGEYIICTSIETLNTHFTFKKYKSIILSQIQFPTLVWRQ